jgi:Uma2 family endonuclease
MVTFIEESRRISVPGWVTDLESFRRWVHSDDFPDEGRIWWLCGEVWVDMSKEQLFTHNVVKAELTMALRLIATTENLGTYFTDGVLLSNFAAEIAGNPDGMFVLTATFGTDRIRLLEGKQAGFVELQGSPDMVLEVISQSSEEKDDVHLRKAYFDAGIPEYWIIDVREEPFRFDVLRRGPRGYVNTRKQGGWVKSATFGRSFRLVARAGPGGYPDYKLESRH